jgi:hypothetical protein
MSGMSGRQATVARRRCGSGLRARSDTPARRRPVNLEHRLMPRPTSLLVAIVGAALTILLSACATGVADRDAACDTAYAQALAVDPGSDTVSAVDGAIASCSSLAAWVAAASRYPDTTAGQDPASYAATRCATSPGLAASVVCTSLPGSSAP